MGYQNDHLFNVSLPSSWKELVILERITGKNYLV